MRRRLIPIAACLLIAACAAIFFADNSAFSGSPTANMPLPARTAILPPNGLLQEGDWRPLQNTSLHLFADSQNPNTGFRRYFCWLDGLMETSFR